MIRCKFIILTLMISLLLCGCSQIIFSDSDTDIYQKIHRRYNDLNSYSATVTMTVKSNKTENVYKMRQCFLCPDSYGITYYEPENVKGLSVLINNDTAKIRKDGMPSDIQTPASDGQNYTFINSFFEMYYKSEQTSISVNRSDGESKFTTLKTNIIDGTSQRYSIALAIDNKTLDPVRITVYNISDEPTVTAIFEDFEYNTKLDDIFNE